MFNPSDRCDCSVEYQVFSSFKYQLSKELRLNLTLKNVYMTPPNVAADKQKYACIRIIENNTKGNGNKVSRLCGIYSIVAFYPNSHTVQIIKKIDQTSFVVKADIIYNVFDSNVIFTSLPQHKANMQPIWLVHFLKSSLFLQVYHIIVSHLKQVEIQFLGNLPFPVQFYDGPGRRSKLINFSSSNKSLKYWSTAFQLVLYSLKPMWPLPFFFRYNEQNQNQMLSIHYNISNLVYFTLPNTANCAVKSICIVKLQTHKDKAINMTLTEFTFEGDFQVDNCSYAGLALYESFEHRKTLCTKQYHTKTYKEECINCKIYHKFGLTHTYKYPTNQDSVQIHSKSNVVSLVFYSYHEYASIEVRISATVSTCQTEVDHYYVYKSISTLSCPPYDMPWNISCLIFPVKYGCKQYVYIQDDASIGKEMTFSGTGMTHGKGLVVSDLKRSISECLSDCLRQKNSSSGPWTFEQQVRSDVRC